MLPYRILRVPRHQVDHVNNLTRWVKDNTKEWYQTGSRMQIPQYPPPKTNLSKEETDKAFARKTEAKLSDGDVRGAIRLTTSNDTIAPRTAETLLTLKSKHPPHPQPTNYPTLDLIPLINEVTIEETRKAISSFPPGSAGGLDSLRPQILKDLISPNNGDAGHKLCEVIQKLMQQVISGQVPTSFTHIFFGAALTALLKKCGGIRPVAVGNTWRRLAAKILCTRVRPIAESFAPHQLGVAVKGGCEIGSHAARIFYNCQNDLDSCAFLKIDFQNAFNEIRRDVMLQKVVAQCPEMFPFLNQAYGCPSALFYGSDVIASELGCQQGDPLLGSFLFSLTIRDIFPVF